GKLGDRAKGGLELNEFLRRQRLHREAEIKSMRDVEAFISKAHEIYGYEHFLNDAGGSICELDDPGAEQVLVDNTLILYIQAGEEMEKELIERAKTHPKPMYYSESFLQQKLQEYLEHEQLQDAGKIDPDAFCQWIFPELVRYRRPKYEQLAAQHGYTVDAAAIEQIETEQDFIELIAGALDS
ncbi:MAG: ATPase, partial [Gammaproteobacteria bacterium]